MADSREESEPLLSNQEDSAPSAPPIPGIPEVTGPGEFTDMSGKVIGLNFQRFWRYRVVKCSVVSSFNSSLLSWLLCLCLSLCLWLCLSYAQCILPKLVATSKETPFCGCSGSNVGLSEQFSHSVIHMYFFPTKCSVSLKLNKLSANGSKSNGTMFFKNNEKSAIFTQQYIMIMSRTHQHNILNLRHWIQLRIIVLSNSQHVRFSVTWWWLYTKTE